jgi:hypothetical protein
MLSQCIPITSCLSPPQKIHSIALGKGDDSSPASARRRHTMKPRLSSSGPPGPRLRELELGGHSPAPPQQIRHLLKDGISGCKFPPSHRVFFFVS